MAKFRMRCNECGEMELGPEAIDLQWCSHEPSSYYRYACPACGRSITKPCDGRTAQTLIAAGVSPRYWHLPAEALEPRSGPPISVDDILDFHLLLAEETWMDTLRSMVDRSAAA